MNKKVLKAIFKSISIILFCFALLSAAPSVINLNFGFNDKCNKSDMIVDYGNKVNQNKTISKKLQTHLDNPLEIYSGLSDKIIVTGGIDSNGNDETEVMKDYFIKTGNIPSPNISLEYCAMEKRRKKNNRAHAKYFLHA